MMRGKASFFGKDIQALRARIEGDDLGADGKGSVESADVTTASRALTRGLSLDGARGMPFVLDAGSARAPPRAPRHARGGISPDPLFCEMDGRFPNHTPIPPSRRTSRRSSRACGRRARVGSPTTATPTDSAPSTRRNVVWGDKLMVLFAGPARAARRRHRHRRGEVLADALRRRRQARRPAARVEDGPLAHQDEDEGDGRAPGRRDERPIFFADRWFGFDDALYAGLRLLEILANDPRPVSEMLADVPVTATTPELRVDCPDAVKFEVVAAVTAHFKAKGVRRARHRRRAHPLPDVLCRADVGARARVEHGADPRDALRGRHRGSSSRRYIRAEVEDVVRAERQKRGG